MENKFTKNIYYIAEKNGEFWGSIFASMLNNTSEITNYSVNVFNAGMKGFKTKANPAINNFIENYNSLNNKNVEYNDKK